MIVRSGGSWTERSRPCPPTLAPDWPPSTQGPFAHAGRYPAAERPDRPLGRTLPLRHRSYGPMRQTKTLLAPRIPPCAPGLCRLLPAPAGRWPFPTLSPRPLRRCSDPYPATLLGCTCPLPSPRTPVSPHGKRVRRADLPPHSNFGGEPISRLQSFVYLRAPTLARPPGCSDRDASRRAAGPFTPRRTRPVTRTGQWRRFMSDTDN